MTRKKSIRLSLLLLAAMFFPSVVQSQVTIGDNISPQSFSLLELISDGSNGLRLPRLTTQQRDELVKTPQFQAERADKAKGLTIFNTTTNCVETWNGNIWISVCAENVAAPTLASVDCSAVTGVSFIVGENKTINLTLPYTKTGEAINLTDNDVLGSADVFSVLVNGNQTLTAASGNINIKITGTPTATGNFNLSYTVGGKSCNIPIAVNQNPATIAAGAGTLSGKTCFDIARSNDNQYGCGALTSRLSQQADFTKTATNTQTYTFTPSGTVSKVRFAYVESVTGVIVQSLTPASDGYATQNNISSVCTATLVYKTSLNNDALGLTEANALKVEIYAIYNDQANGTGADKTVRLTAMIKDCACCGAKTADGGWLTFMCHNLGADTSLDPFTYVVGNADGSGGTLGYLYQWGRPSDGHEKRNSKTTSTLATNNTATAPVSVAGKFIKVPGFDTDWLTGANDGTRWGDGTLGLNQNKAQNDPCPDGWKVPSWEQMISIFNIEKKEIGYTNANVNPWVWTGNGLQIGEHLYLPGAGTRDAASGDVSEVGSLAAYWTTPGASENHNADAHRYDGIFARNTQLLVVGIPGLSVMYAPQGRSIRCVSE